MTEDRNLIAHHGSVSRDDRERLLGQRGCVLWFTGLSGSGKSTLARAAERALHDAGRACYVLDGDNVRLRLNRDLGFSAADRHENIRRVGEVAALMADAGLLVLTAFISPYCADREQARQAVGADRFLEIHVHAELDVCEARDPKGLYRRARAGEIGDFTGINAPYEEPPAPALTVDTGNGSVKSGVSAVIGLLRQRQFIPTTNEAYRE